MVSIPVVQKQLNLFKVEGKKFVENQKKKNYSNQWQELLKIEIETEKELNDIDVKLPEDVNQEIQKTLKALIEMKNKKDPEQAAVAVVVALRAIEELQGKLGKVNIPGKSSLTDIKVHKGEPGAGR